MEVPGFLDFPAVLLVLGALALIIFLRYLLFSSVYHYTTFRLLRRWLGKRILDPSPLKRKQLIREIFWSAISGLIFACFGLLTYWLWEAGYTAIYSDWESMPLWYFPLSIFLVLFLQDTYYYWVHRWMHIPRIYKYVHKIHHDSIHTSAWTSFSFHPLETLLQAVVLPLIVMVLPLHYWAVLVVLLIMTVSATINHAGVEVYPGASRSSLIQKNIIGATHHDLHHRKFLCNYGLYFTWWDRWMGTEK